MDSFTTNGATSEQACAIAIPRAFARSPRSGKASPPSRRIARRAVIPALGTWGFLGYALYRQAWYHEPLRFRIFGPAGGGDYPSTTAFVDRLFGPKGAFAYLAKFRNRLDFEVADLPIAQDVPIREVLREADLRVTSVAVDHGDAPAVAFRLEHAGHAVVVSGDLASKNSNLEHLADGADLLVYDTTVLDPPGSPPPLYDLHTAPRRIGEVAARARVKSLLLSHITQDVERSEDVVLSSVRRSFSGPTQLASDCLRIDLAM